MGFLRAVRVRFGFGRGREGEREREREREGERERGRETEREREKERERGTEFAYCTIQTRELTLLGWCIRQIRLEPSVHTCV